VLPGSGGVCVTGSQPSALGTRYVKPAVQQFFLHGHNQHWDLSCARQQSVSHLCSPGYWLTGKALPLQGKRHRSSPSLGAAEKGEEEKLWLLCLASLL